MTNPAIPVILEVLEKTYKGTTSALNFSSPFELLVAVILSAQTNDNQVNKITDILFKEYRTPEDFARLTPEELEPLIKTCGLYKNKAQNIIGSARLIMDKFEGQVPQTREELMELPGVGPKTANVVLSNAFNIPALAVDTHVFRVSHRLGLSSSRSPKGTELELIQIIPSEKWGEAHHWLIWHGRKICIAKKPKCFECPLGEYCPANQIERRIDR